MKKLLLALVVLTLFVTVGVPTLGGFLMAKKARTERLERRSSVDDGPAIAAFVADHSALKDHWLVRRHEGGDASVVLMPRVAFRGAKIEGEAKLGVPKATADAIQGYGKDWAAHVDDAPVDGVDIAWMSELPRYGYWDLEVEGSPMNIAPWFFPEAPIPDFISLQALHKTRLLVGLKTGELAPAIAEARALARLCASTELLIGEMVAVAMLGNEVRAIEAAKARGLDVAALLPDLAVADEGTVERLKRACFATPMAYRLDEPAPGLVDNVQICQCSGLQEGIGAADFLRPFVADIYPARYEALEAQLASSSCRLKNARASFAAGKTRTTTENLRTFCALSPDVSEDAFCSAPGVVAKMPFLREAVGEVLLSIGEPDWLGRYREALSSSGPTSTSP